ncbi:MAG: alpha/beta fold hydrolase [Desulfobacterales bacterium]|nr:alpha/beta fold hydrolase [Desulfobacterales bacterium]MBS3755423.1 alpha/beta fold hydrolase [Desulfobacterales bacterium]
MQETLFFQADGLRLHGCLHMPGAQNPPVVIGVHGMLSNGDSPKQKALAKRCNRMGLAYFRFDHRGCGQSQGEFARVTTFDGRRNDLVAAIEMLHKRPDLSGELGLFGSSMGGAAVLSVAGIYDIRAFVTLAAPIRFSAIRVPLSHEINPAFEGIEPARMEFDVSERLPLVHHILICHGDEDQIVPYENALEIRDAAADPKQLLCLPGSDHPISNPVHQQAFMDTSLEWLEKHLAKINA